MDRALVWAARGFISSLACAALAGMLASCSGGGGSAVPAPPGSAQLPGNNTQVVVARQAYDGLSGGPCQLSYDGLIWYTVPAGSFPPIDASFARCSSAATLHVNPSPAMPGWAHPVQTQAVFIATSLMEHPFAPTGVTALHAVATSAHVPLTWMIGNVAYLQNPNYEIFNEYHNENGDDVEMESTNPEFVRVGRERFPWFVPTVSVEGAGHERNIERVLKYRERGFWGITWDSLNVDGTSDRGAPWGTYCADPSSYKRPTRNGNCTLLSLEWTARDLTRAYYSGHDDFYSTDPDDVLIRGQFGVQGGSAYVRSLVDAYAAAAESQPLVMMSQQEAPEMTAGAGGDAAVLGALYQEAVAVGMKPMTLASGAPVAATFSNRPRAVAFPFIPGGYTLPRNGSALMPSTIDYHDNIAGMTFEGGHTTPSRVFEYAQDPVSHFNVPLTPLSSAQYPKLTMVAVSGGKLFFHFDAGAPLHYGVAIWTNPASLGLSGTNVSTSGRAAAVIVFDVPAGASDQSVACEHCSGATLPLSL